MSKAIKSTTEINIMPHQNGDFISFTDMVRNFDGRNALIEQWLKNKDTVLYPAMDEVSV
jgi:hypothetical protein